MESDHPKPVDGDDEKPGQTPETTQPQGHQRENSGAPAAPVSDKDAVELKSEADNKKGPPDGRGKKEKPVKTPKVKTEAVAVAPAFGTPLVTLALVIINILVFLMMYKHDPGALWHPSSQLLLNAGADYGPLFAGGQWWRSCTSGFVHIGVIHLGLNMLALWSIGGSLEPQIGTLKYVLVYAVSLIAASFMSLDCRPFVESAGASGAIFGLLGCQMITILSLWKQIPKLRLFNSLAGDLMVIGLYIAVGFFVPFMDGYAHLGGFVGGLVASIVLMPLGFRTKLPNLINIVGVVALLFGLKQAGAMVEQRTKQATAAMTPYQTAHTNAILKKNELPFWLPSRVGSPVELLGAASLEAPDYGTAIKIANSEIDLDKTNGYAYYSRALVQHKFNHAQEAIEDVQKALELIPGQYRFTVLKATIELQQKHISEALNDTMAALKMKAKEHGEAYDVAGCAKLLEGDRKEATNYFSKAIAENAELGCAYFHRAIVRELNGEQLKAQQDFIRAQDDSYVPNQWDLNYMKKMHLIVRQEGQPQ
jgi:membrane associated rhomboid family serine protease